MQLQRLDKYEPGVRIIALFPGGIYRHRGPGDVSRRATKVSAGEVLVVHGDDPIKWDGLLVRRESDELHYIIHSRGDFAVAPEPYQIAWLLVDGQIQRGRADRLQARLDEAEAEIRRMREQIAADRQIFKGEQALLKAALGYLEKLHDLTREADEDFNFSGDHDPDGAPDA